MVQILHVALIRDCIDSGLKIRTDILLAFFKEGI
jgi:hypothetical protein